MEMYSRLERAFICGMSGPLPKFPSGITFHMSGLYKGQGDVKFQNDSFITKIHLGVLRGTVDGCIWLISSSLLVNYKRIILLLLPRLATEYEHKIE